MMKLGAMLYRFREVRQQGMRATFYRDVVRKRILKTIPVKGIGTDEHCDVHAITSIGDWLNLMWTLKSFYRFSSRRYGLCIHDDGSLTDEIACQFEQHFLGARVIRRREADAKVLSLLQEFPNCSKIRNLYFICMKEFDFKVYARSDRILCVDSDVLFFSEPKELLRRIDDPTYEFSCFNRDVETAYSCTPQEISKAYGFEMIERFNSGLGMIHKEALDWKLMESTFDKINIMGHPWRFEQTLMGICAVKYGVELLPDTFDVSLISPCRERAVKHYVGEIRNDMYREGMVHLVRNGFLKEK
jgi:hypothetical protein